MPNTALNRTTQVLLTNKSGGALVYGDVVVLDNTNASSFTTTTTAGLDTRGLGVILEPNGIANNASGMVAIGGWCPQVNLNTAATVGQLIKTHTVAGQATPHSSPQVAGDFGYVLEASANPAAMLFGSANASAGTGTVTNTGTLTANAVILGNGSADVTALGSLGTTTTVLHGNAAGAPTFGAVALGADVSGDLPFANLTQIAGLSVLGVTGSATADVAAITAATNGYVLTRVSSSSLTFAAPLGALITETVTTGSAASVTFSSIPATFRDLLVIARGRSNVVATSVILRVQFNSDSGANYDFSKFDAQGGASGGGSGGQGNAQTSADFGYLSGSTAPANRSSSCSLFIYDYRGTTFTKTGRSIGDLVTADSAGGYFTTNGVIGWRSTTAITQIDVTLSSSTFVDGSVVSLYGLF